MAVASKLDLPSVVVTSDAANKNSRSMHWKLAINLQRQIPINLKKKT